MRNICIKSRLFLFSSNIEVEVVSYFSIYTVYIDIDRFINTCMDIKVSLPTLAIETIASEESVTSAYE
jgi:hypothetical protein